MKPIKDIFGDEISVHRSNENTLMVSMVSTYMADDLGSPVALNYLLDKKASKKLIKALKKYSKELS